MWFWKKTKRTTRKTNKQALSEVNEKKQIIRIEYLKNKFNNGVKYFQKKTFYVIFYFKITKDVAENRLVYTPRLNSETVSTDFKRIK